MDTLKQFLSQSNGQLSSTRLMSLLCVLCAIGLAITGLLRGADLYALAALCGAFLGAAFGGKVAQKKLE